MQEQMFDEMKMPVYRYYMFYSSCLSSSPQTATDRRGSGEVSGPGGAYQHYL